MQSREEAHGTAFVAICNFLRLVSGWSAGLVPMNTVPFNITAFCVALSVSRTVSVTDYSGHIR